jgi:WD40 repeat protein
VLRGNNSGLTSPPKSSSRNVIGNHLKSEIMRHVIIFFAFLILYSFTYSQNEVYKFHKKLSTWGIAGIPDNVYFNSISFSLDEKHLAAAGESGSLIIWDIETGGIYKNLTDTNKDTYFFIRALEFSNDGRYLAAVGNSSYQKYNVITKDNQNTIEKVGDSIVYEVIRVYDAKKFNLIKELKFDTTTNFLSCSFSPDSKYYITGESKPPKYNISTIRVFETSDWNQISFVNPIDIPWDLTFNPMGNKLYTGTSQGFICQWNFSNKILTPLTPMKISSKSIEHISISPDNKFFSINQDTLRIYHLDTTSISTLLTITDYGLFCTSFSKNAKYIATGNNDNSCKIFDAKDYSLLQTLQGDIDKPMQNEGGQNYTRPFFSLSSEYLAMTNDAGIIYIYKINK